MFLNLCASTFRTQIRFYTQNNNSYSMVPITALFCLLIGLCCCFLIKSYCLNTVYTSLHCILHTLLILSHVFHTHHLLLISKIF